MDAKVLRLFTAAKAAVPMSEVREIRTIEGKGIEGDRKFRANGAEPKRQLTLIELEAIEAVGRDYDIEIGPEETRRNVVVSGVALNHLVGREFMVGAVRLRGIKLCEPCAHLEKLTGKRVLAAFAHRGGLNAEILIGGVIRVGDRIDLEPEERTEKSPAAKAR